MFYRQTITICAITSILSINAPVANANDIFGNIGKGVGSLFSKKDKKPEIKQGISCGSKTGSIIGGIGILTGNDTMKNVAGAIAVACTVSEVFAQLSQQDQEKLSQSTQTTMTTGKESHWVNEATGARGTVSVTKNNSRTKKKKIKVLKGKIVALPPLESIGAEYSVNTKSNVRGGPGSDYEVIDKLSTGQTVFISAKVVDKPWYMLSSGGVGTGFVHSSLLTETGMIGDPGQVPEGKIQKKKVALTLSCKTISQNVELPNGEEVTDIFETCQKSDGTWKRTV